MPSFNPAPQSGAFAAIPTKLHGVQFRSRLEARWATFFTLLGWEWHYEPFDLEGYIPDFILPSAGVAPTLVEVKPWVERTEKAFGEGWKDLKALGRPAVLVGAYPHVYAPKHQRLHFMGYWADSPAMARLRQRARDADEEGRNADECWVPDDDLAFVVRCGDKQAGHWRLTGFEEAIGKTPCRWCGTSRPGGAWFSEVDRLWKEAGNQVQWRSPRR